MSSLHAARVNCTVSLKMTSGQPLLTVDCWCRVEKFWAARVNKVVTEWVSGGWSTVDPMGHSLSIFTCVSFFCSQTYMQDEVTQRIVFVPQGTSFKVQAGENDTSIFIPEVDEKTYSHIRCHLVVKQKMWTKLHPQKTFRLKLLGVASNLQARWFADSFVAKISFKKTHYQNI